MALGASVAYVGHGFVQMEISWWSSQRDECKLSVTRLKLNS